MTSLRPETGDEDLHRPQTIKYSTSPPCSSSGSSPKFSREELPHFDSDIHGDESPSSNPTMTPSRAFYIPAGSVSSHEGDSLSDSEDGAHLMHGVDQPPLSQDSGATFQPTTDNVIVFEVYTPPNQDFSQPGLKHTGKKFLFSDDHPQLDKCYLIPEEKDTPSPLNPDPAFDLFQDFSSSHREDSDPILTDHSQGKDPVILQGISVSSPEMLEPLRSGESGDEEEEPSRFAHTMNFVRTDKKLLEKEVARLQELLHEGVNEIDQLRSESQDKDRIIREYEKQIRVRPDSSNKQTMTSPVEDAPEVSKLQKENEQLVGTCTRYERQNQELRKEIQECTRDLMNVDKAKNRLAKELKKATKTAETYELEMVKIAEFMTKVISPDAEESWDKEERDPHHLSNYLASKIEIIGSRHSRLQAIHENVVEENMKLKQDLNSRMMQNQAESVQFADTIKQLNSRLKLKESIIQKLEGKLLNYKETLAEGLESEPRDFQGKPRNMTENFSNKLKTISEGTYHSSQVSPNHSANSHAIKKLLSESKRLLEESERSRGQLERGSHIDVQELEGIREQPYVESDEELYISGDHSSSESHPELNKTETPVHDKRHAWKAKQDRRHPPHVRTQSYMQSLLASEHYTPVLTYREALKDLREISTRASRAIEESSLTRQFVKEGMSTTPIRQGVSVERQTREEERLTPKLFSKLAEAHPKSSSADRRKKPKEIDTSASNSVKDDPEYLKGKNKYRSSYVAALLKW